MTKFYKRVLMISVALPVFFVIIYVVPYYSHLVFNLVVIGSTTIGAIEIQGLLQKKNIRSYKWLAPILGGTIPLVSYLEITGILRPQSTLLWIVLAVAVVLIRCSLVWKKEDLAPILLMMSSSILIVIYPGLFASYMVRLATFENASLVLLLFLSLVFSNDVLAYLSGSLLGKEWLKIPASPKKTLIGFVVGFSGSVGISILYYWISPDLFSHKFVWSIWIGCSVGLATILGDLLESAMKRSAEVKDSGTVIPGRGGMLDSMDSMLLSAPVLYYCFLIMHLQ